MPDKTPWQRGYDDALANKPARAFPTADSSWAYRLYDAGWLAGMRAAAAMAKGVEL